LEHLCTFGTAIVARFDKCAGVEDLLVIAVQTDSYSKKIKRNTVELSFLHYVEYLKRINKNKSTSWKGTLVKVEKFNNPKQPQDMDIFYYSLVNYKKK